MNAKNVPILIVGGSGTGKSTSAESLPRGKTLIINIEDKKLPTNEADAFTTKYVRSYKQIIALLNALSNPEKLPADKQAEYMQYEYVFFDSFTALTEVVEKYCSISFSGYTQWQKYNELLQDIIHKIKQIPQSIIVTAIPEQKEVGFSEIKEYAKVKGKELKYGYLESQFTIVLYTNPVYAEEDDPAKDIEAGDMIECYLRYRPSKVNTAKSPPGMFQGKIPNSAKAVFEAVDKYYGHSE